MTSKGFAVSTPLTDAEIEALRAKSRRVAQLFKQSITNSDLMEKIDEQSQAQAD